MTEGTPPAAAVERDPRLPFASLSREFLKPRDPVLGYVKIGGKAQEPRFTSAGKPWLAPVRYVNPPRFEVTTREKVIKKVQGKKGTRAAGETFNVDFGYKRDAAYHARLEELAKSNGEPPGSGENPTSLRVRLMYPTPAENVITFLGAYGGSSWVCRGNGVEAIDEKRGECPCPCPRLAQFDGEYGGPPLPKGDSLACRPHGQLNLLLQDAETFGGFWAFKTTSYETISNILHVLEQMHGIFGTVAGLPFELRVMAASKSYGGGMTTQPIVTLVLAASMETARRIARDAAEESMRFLPMSPPEREEYEAAVLEEMEEEGQSYGEEFASENVVGADEVGEPEEDEGPFVEPVDDDDEAEPVEAEELPPEDPAAEPEPEASATPEEDAAAELERQKELASAVLRALGWDEKPIADRVGHHVATRTMGKLLDGLARLYPDAWAEATQRDLLEQR